MRYLLLLSVLCCSNAEALTWRFAGSNLGGSNISTPKDIPVEDFRKGIRDGITAINRYFNVSLVEKTSGNCDLYVMVHNRIPPNWPSWLLETAWQSNSPYKTINFGVHCLGNPDSIRRTMMHELTHHFGLYLDGVHPGNRVTDIGGGDSTWTPLDVQLLAKVGITRKAGTPHPWEDEKWWTDNTPPKAVDDFYKVPMGTKITVSPLDNDIDPDVGQTLRINKVTPWFTTIPYTLSTSNQLTVDPPPTYTGNAWYTYQMNDGRNFSTATVTISFFKEDSYPWTNPKLAADVDNNGKVTTWDALTVLNALHNNIKYDETVKPAFFYDANGDKQITAADASFVLGEI